MVVAAERDERILHAVGPVQRRTRVEIRPLDPADAPYVRATWRETHHQAPGKRRIPWSAYKLTFGAQIDALLAREDVLILAAYDDAGKVQGWIAWTIEPATVHYVFTRLDSRRQGLALRLIEAADLGASFDYTHKGVKMKRAEWPSADEMLAATLAKRAVTATYMPASQFLR